MFVGMKTQFPPGINKVSLIRKNLGEMFQKKINILNVIIYKLREPFALAALQLF